jgi:glutamate racemase
VVKALVKALPEENIVYLGDTARVPYGTKSRDTVTRFSMECLGFLDNFNLKMAVVACNTASSFSRDTLKRSFDFPVIGVIEPGVKEACGRTRNDKIGVIGTRATVKSASYVKAIKKISSRVKVYQKACPLFVPLVEENWLDDDVTMAVAAKYIWKK